MRPRGWKGRHAIAERLARLIRLLERRRVRPPIAELAQTLAVDVRTVYRDLAALEAAHWPLPPRADELDDLGDAHHVSLSAEVWP